MAAAGEGEAAVPARGWSTSLYWLQVLYNAVAFVVVLTASILLAWIGADLLHLDLTSGRRLAAFVVAIAVALLFGGVPGSLQWLVVRERVPVPRKRWITNVGPVLLSWLIVINPMVITDENGMRA